jgi:hypothetical protein
MITVLDREVIYRFITNYYDLPLEGSCYYDGKLYHFKRSDEVDEDGWLTDNLNLYPLNRYQQFKWKLRQSLFESFVGEHWSWYARKRNSKLKPAWMRWVYYKLKKIKL